MGHLNISEQNSILEVFKLGMIIRSKGDVAISVWSQHVLVIDALFSLHFHNSAKPPSKAHPNVLILRKTFLVMIK